MLSKIFVSDPEVLLQGAWHAKQWPVPGYPNLNVADKQGEGHGWFGSPRWGGQTHKGIDIEAPQGTEVVAVDDGRVVNIQPNPSGTYGLQVVINHNNGYFSQSAHLDTVLVQPGQTVLAGDVIGTVGRTGNTPPAGDTHLHFEIRQGSPAPASAGGTVVDPMLHLPPP